VSGGKRQEKKLGGAFRVLGLAATCTFLLASSSSAAEWRSVSPGGQINDISIDDASRWLVTTPAPACCARSLRLTEDAGATWSQFEAPNGYVATSLASPADGSFRLVATQDFGQPDEALQAYDVSAAGVQPLGPPISGSNRDSDAFAVAENGDTWIPYWDQAQNAFFLAIVAPDGTVTTVPLPSEPNTSHWAARQTLLGMRLLRFEPSATLGNGVFARETFRRDELGAFVPAEAFPVTFAEGDLLLSSDVGAGSWDGGAHWSSSYVRTVPRVSPGGQPRFVTFNGGVVGEQYSPSLFRGMGVSWPQGASTNFVVDAGEVLIAWSFDTIFVHDLPLPPPALEVGSLQADAKALIGRADTFRADVGLPPLIGDEKLSQAARNHSQYTALHPKEIEGSFHNEQSGLSGFTGTEPWFRCEAVGTTCNSEIMHSLSAPDAVDDWLATIYHRPLIGAPEAGVVGGGQVEGGWSVMDSKSTANLLVRPFGYPSGRWRGGAGFSGEIPDPVVGCQEAGQPISYPIGIAVSLYLPTESAAVSRIRVVRHGDSIPLPGCLLSDYVGGRKSAGVFVLDDPLVQGQTYDVSAEWNPGPYEVPGGASIASPDLPFSWSFTFSPDKGSAKGTKSARCRPLALRRMRSVAPARRRGLAHPRLGLEEKVTMRQAARVRLRSARLHYWVAKTEHTIQLATPALRKRFRRVGPVSYLRFQLPRKILRHIVPGEPAELRISMLGRRVKGCRKLVHIGRVRKVRIGWVRTRGAASWSRGRGAG
jgi:hypothetical protein